MFASRLSISDFISLDFGHVELRSCLSRDLFGRSALVVFEDEGREKPCDWHICVPRKRTIEDYAVANEFLLKFLEERIVLLELILTRQ